VEPTEEQFAGFVFKIHANMDPRHRDRIAFMRICSGTFERNTNYLHVRQGRKLKFANPTSFMADRKEVIDAAYAGDVVGLYDSGNFKIGDTLTEGEELHFRGIPSFSPEQFRRVINGDPMKSKQLAKGIDQLMDEGVAQLFTREVDNAQIIGTVGALQFDVIQYRLEHEYGATVLYEPINLYKALWVTAASADDLRAFTDRRRQQIAVDKGGRTVYLADSAWTLQMARDNHPGIEFHETSER
jgi:peptide chain release factor 3